MCEHVRVELRVEHEASGARGPDEGLAVEGEPAIARERGEHVGREVAAGQAADLHPLRPSHGRDVVQRPR